MSHHCHAYQCETETKPETFMCLKHWKTLPPYLQHQVCAAYRSGQCDDWKITPAYADAAKRCIRFVASREDFEIPSDAEELTMYDYLLENR